MILPKKLDFVKFVDTCFNLGIFRAREKVVQFYAALPMLDALARHSPKTIWHDTL